MNQAEPFTIDILGRWSYPAVVLPYFVMVGCLMFYFRVTFRFEPWRVFFLFTFNALLILGFAFEVMADIFQVWSFPPGRDLFDVRVPVFGWFTGHRVPICEVLWIAVAIPMFYYLYLWHAFLYHDLIFVVDRDGRFYKREERWAGFFNETRVLVRPKEAADGCDEVVIKRRRPGFVARGLAAVLRRYFPHLAPIPNPPGPPTR